MTDKRFIIQGSDIDHTRQIQSDLMTVNNDCRGRVMCFNQLQSGGCNVLYAGTLVAERPAMTTSTEGRRNV